LFLAWAPSFGFVVAQIEFGTVFVFAALVSPVLEAR
jgi:hypothetical protein